MSKLERKIHLIGREAVIADAAASEEKEVL